MPSSDAILLGVTDIANRWRTVAIARHAAFALALTGRQYLSALVVFS